MEENPEVEQAAPDVVSLDMFSEPDIQLTLSDLEAPSERAVFGHSLFGKETEPERSKGKLGEQFIVPPFSVLDTRQGYWQERKRAWCGLGIRSELGRIKDAQATGKGSVYGGTSEWTGPRGPAQPFGQDILTGEAIVQPERGLKNVGTERQAPKPEGGNLLKFSAAMSITRNGQGFDGSKIYTGEIDREGAEANSTSIFDPVLCELFYRWFCPTDGLVLDPFAGGSVRGVVAGLLGLRYIGIDLREEQIAANRIQWQELGVAGMGLSEYAVQWIEGDSREAGIYLNESEADFIFSCPPYADLERYSDDPRDLSTLSYEAFVEAYREIIAVALTRLKPDRFACFVVTEIRGPKEGIYRGFVQDTIEAFEAGGAKYYNEATLINCFGSLPLRVQKQFNVTRKLGRSHQYVLVFLKGNAREAAKACKEIVLWRTRGDEEAEAAAKESGEEIDENEQ